VPAPVHTADKLDPVWKALSDPTRRAMLDILRDGPRTTTELVDAFPRLTRFGVMKHVDVLRKAGLVQTREEGRQRVNSLNAVPIRQIYERWVGPFQELWTGHLLGLKAAIEEESPGGTRKRLRRPKKK
jgi:DNA-binding transcriptional ArsR family regulator